MSKKRLVFRITRKLATASAVASTVTAIGCGTGVTSNPAPENNVNNEETDMGQVISNPAPTNNFNAPDMPGDAGSGDAGSDDAGGAADAGDAGGASADGGTADGGAAPDGG